MSNLDYLTLFEIKQRIKSRCGDKMEVNYGSPIGLLKLRDNAGSTSIRDKFENGIVFNNDGINFASFIKDGTHMSFKFDMCNATLYDMLVNDPSMEYLITYLNSSSIGSLR